MSNNPYILPDHPCTVNFSGGRSSAYMLHRILDAYDGVLNEQHRVVFANTGKELPATLDFVAECQRRWNVDVTWLEYRYRDERPKHHYEIVSHNSASRHGEPFEARINVSGFLPNATQRTCTADLKIETIARYCRRELSWKTWHTVIGIRHDEPKRWHRIMEACATSLSGKRYSVLPMALDGVTEADIMEFWRRQPFDLGLQPYQGNCDLCFLKGKSKLLRIIRENPELADWWIRMEESVPPMDGTQNRRTFTDGRQYSDLAEWSKRDMLFPYEESEIDCFCGD